MTNKEFQEWLKQYPDDAEVLIETTSYNREYSITEPLKVNSNYPRIKFHTHYENGNGLLYGIKKFVGDNVIVIRDDWKPSPESDYPY